MSTLIITPSGINPPVFTWASKPAAGSFTGLAFMSDVGVNGSTWRSDGVTWLPINGVVPIINGGLPVYLPSSGLMGNNGALSAITALPIAFAACYMYFPANAIAAGVPAGKYFVAMSSTTAGTIYNNLYTSGVPSIPASPTPFVTTGPGAYAQTTGAAITLVSAPLLGGTTGLYGMIEGRALTSTNSSAGAKNTQLSLSATPFGVATGTTSATTDITKRINNIGLENRQVYHLSAVIGTASGVASALGTVDTSLDTTLSITTSVAVATDFCGVTQYSFQITR